MSEKDSPEQKSKARKLRDVRLSPAEEIVVKLASNSAEQEQHHRHLQYLVDKLEQLQQQFEELKQMNQAASDDIVVLKKRLQTTEEIVRAESESTRGAQQKGEQRCHFLEGKIRNLENAVAEFVKRSVEATGEQTTAAALSGDEVKEQTAQQSLIENALRQKQLETLQKIPESRRDKTIDAIETEVSTMAIRTIDGFAIESGIHVSGKGVLRFTRDQLPFHITWYARKLTGGASMLLQRMHASIIANQRECTIKVNVPRLEAGMYRLTTVVSFPTIGNLTTYYQGPVIQST